MTAPTPEQTAARVASALRRIDRGGPRGLTMVTYDEIEALWAPIAGRDDWTGFYRKLTEIETMRQAYGLAD